MAAAYASLISLMHNIDKVRLYHSFRSVLSEKQERQTESLHKKVVFLKDFLEGYDYGHAREIDGLENRIANATYIAEDIIESYVIYDILAQFSQSSRDIVGKDSNHSPQDLKTAIAGLDSIKKEVLTVMEKRKFKDQHLNAYPIISSSPYHVGKHADTMVDFDDELIPLMEKLIGEPKSREVFPITGMGGIGKTTLAKTVYEHPLTKERFDLRSFFSISQVYNVREVLLGLLRESGAPKALLENCDYDESGERLYKHLIGRRYLIVLDDMWSITVWDELMRFLPDNDNGSRIIITTRLSDVANNFGSSHKMNLLDENKSWRLLCKKVFGENNCPPELKGIGKDIAQSCKGLPISISLIGGLLAKSRMTPSEWEDYGRNINRTLNSADNEYCSRILSFSYNHLPIHLKPCFLYMGIFPEDHHIQASELIKLWVAEGFVKPIERKTLEEAAEEYLKDLIERHLIILVKRRSTGEIKTCSIHDLLRNLCLRETHKERFPYTTTPQNDELRLNSDHGFLLEESCIHERDQSLLQIKESVFEWSTCETREESLKPFNLRLMRVLNLEMLDHFDIEKFKSKLFYSRFLEFRASRFVYPMHRLWNLQTLIVDLGEIMPLDIWKMPQLRHLIVQHGINLPDPESGGLHGRDVVVLENLQTLAVIESLKFLEDVVIRIPNVKKLKIMFSDDHLETEKGLADYCLQNLNCLRKLQSFSGIYEYGDLLKYVHLPHSLKKLTLCCNISWEDVVANIGPLPHLEKLKLTTSHSGESWITVDGQFCRLKFLSITQSFLMVEDGLVFWEAEATHFPVLEHLYLSRVNGLHEIPSGIGDIFTLQSIKLVDCYGPIVASAKKILEEQQSFGNDSLCLEIKRSMNRSRAFHNLSDFFQS